MAICSFVEFYGTHCIDIGHKEDGTVVIINYARRPMLQLLSRSHITVLFLEKMKVIKMP